MITLKESILGKTTDKVKEIADMSASEIAAGMGFPRENEYNTATGGVVYYEWDYQPLVQDNKEILKEYFKLSTPYSVTWVDNPRTKYDRIKIYTKVWPLKNPSTGKIVRFIDVGLSMYNHHRLKFSVMQEGGSKSAAIKKAYTILEHIRDDDGLFTEIIKCSIEHCKNREDKTYDMFEVAKRLIKKYGINI